MILAFVLMQAAAPPPVEPTNDIVVIARKLQDWRASFRMKKGKYACQVMRSTGDADIDRLGCEAMRTCLIPAVRRLEATRAKGIDKAMRKRMTDEVNAAMTACVRETRAALIAELAERRAGGGK